MQKMYRAIWPSLFCVKLAPMERRLRGALTAILPKGGAQAGLSRRRPMRLTPSRADVFCLVSSDGDFTPLAIHLRGAGKRVVGIGTKQASTSFRQSCDAFHIVSQPTTVPVVVATTSKPRAKPQEQPAKQKISLPLLSKAFKRLGAGEGDGWVSLSTLGVALREVEPNFTVKSYGSASLKKLLLQESSLEWQPCANKIVVRLGPAIAVISA